MTRCTLAAIAEVSGRGLFTGRPAALRIHPGENGIELRRGRIAIPATINLLAPPRTGMPARNTVLAAGPGDVFVTTEHVLSALVGLGITDAVVEFTEAEAPIGDGSAGFIVEAIRKAGVAVREK